MPKWLSYLALLPGLIIAIKLAFGWEVQTMENVGLSGMLVVIGIVLLGISQAEALVPSERNEEAQEADINFAFTRFMATTLVSLCMVSFSLFIMQDKESFDNTVLFWFSLPFLFILLCIKYYQVWRLKVFLYGRGRIAEGVILTAERQIHHKKGNIYQHVTFEYEVPEKGLFTGEATCPYSPFTSYEKESAVQVLYDPAKPQHCLLLNAWHGKGLQSGKEYYKKLTRPDEGNA